jgi:hypothetical protein
VVWFIYPKLKCYVEEPDMGSPANFSKESPSFEVEKPAETAGDLTRKFVGFEMRDSYRMRKYLIKIDYSNIKGSDSYYEWRRDDFPIPVRTESLDGRTYFEYSAIHRGPFDPDLFHEPKKLQKGHSRRIRDSHEQLQGKAERDEEELSFCRTLI